MAHIFDALALELGSDCLSYQEALHLLALRQALSTAQSSILDLGSGHCSFTLEPNLDELKAILAPHPTVCLWPSRDPHRAVRILCKRNRRDPIETAREMRRHRGRSIARAVVYTEWDGIDAVASRVLDLERSFAR